MTPAKAGRGTYYRRREPPDRAGVVAPTRRRHRTAMTASRTPHTPQEEPAGHDRGTSTDYSQYSAYDCAYCWESCINKTDSVPARAMLCRKCIQNPAAFEHGALDRREFERMTEDY